MTCKSKTLRLATLLLVILLTTAACTSERSIRKKGELLQEELIKASTDFNRMISWRYYDDASTMVVPESKADFLMQAEAVNQQVNMEGFRITLVQVSSLPFPRVRGEVKHEPKPKEDIPPSIAASIAAQEAKTEKQPDTSPAAKAEKEKSLEMPKIWYGLVLVRYENLIIAPHHTVRSPLMRQYWYYTEEIGAWLVDPEIEQLLGLYEPEEAPAPEKAPTAKPLVPKP